MSRTTIDIDAPVLHEIRSISRESGRSMGRVVSDLLAAALAARRDLEAQERPFQWVSRPMDARVDLRDKDAVYGAMGVEEQLPQS